MDRSPKSPRKPAPAPTETSLREAALAHVARFATTQAGLVRVLDRRIERWARGVESPEPAILIAAREAASRVAAALVALGLIDDAAFAAARARRLARAGRSRLQVSAHLAARGVTGQAARDAMPAAPELASAVLLTRRRRIGPFRPAPVDDAARRRELGVLARAGFPQDVAQQALDTARDDAEAMLEALRQI